MSDEETNRMRECHDKDTMKILLATDIHLGYGNDKRHQENDSFVTFEEILQHAHAQDVDLILLGGDLFHDSTPSQKVILQCMELLKKYTLGKRELQVTFMSNPDEVCPHSAQKIVNFEDPNMNIAMPIFSIHGNHDNPSFETTGAMDVLGASGLINYFGKWLNVTSVTIPPLIFNKGKTYVSVYGLGYINDQRLSRLLQDEQLILMQPAGIPEPFKMLVLHQNRAKHTANDCIPENELPECLDLIFWGHEHECRVTAEHIVDTKVDHPRSYYITQPGSSVATSLCAAEAVEKKIGLLKVNERDFDIHPIKLKTVRPFVFEDLYLRKVKLKKDMTRTPSDIVYEYIDDYVEHMLSKAKNQITDNPNQPKIPLIRLRIFYTEDTQVFNVIKFSRKYIERVANPRDMIFFRKEKEKGPEDDKKNVFDKADEDCEEIRECFQTNDDDDWNRTVQGGIRNLFTREDQKDDLKVLSVLGLNEALKHFVEAGDGDAFKNIVDHETKEVQAYLNRFDLDDEKDIEEQLIIYRAERRKAEDTGDNVQEATKVLTAAAGKIRKKPTQSKTAAVREDSDVDESDNLDDQEEQPATRGRGRGSRARGRGSRGNTTTTRGSTRGKGKADVAKSALTVNIGSFFPTANSSIKVTGGKMFKFLTLGKNGFYRIEEIVSLSSIFYILYRSIIVNVIIYLY